MLMKIKFKNGKECSLDQTNVIAVTVIWFHVSVILPDNGQHVLICRRKYGETFYDTAIFHNDPDEHWRDLTNHGYFKDVVYWAFIPEIKFND